jgi:hypothetical protein
VRSRSAITASRAQLHVTLGEEVDVAEGNAAQRVDIGDRFERGGLHAASFTDSQHARKMLRALRQTLPVDTGATRTQRTAS